VFLTLLQNAGLILAAALMQRFILDRWPGSPLPARLASGLLFGMAAVIAMSLAYVQQSGVIFDTRTVVLSVGALFGGALVALLSSLIAIVYRVWQIGGDGAWVGVAVIVSAALLGYLARLTCRGRVDALRHPQFLALGLLVHVVTVGWFALLPLDYVHDVLLGLAPVYIPLLTLATLAMALILRELNAIRRYEKSLLDSRARVQQLFEHAAVALCDEDFSELLKALETLRQAGIRDIARYLDEWPDEVERLASLIRVVQVNPAAVRLMGAQSRSELLGDLNRFFSEDARRSFREQLVAIWEQRDVFQTETSFIRADGSAVDAALIVPIPTTLVRAAHVPVSLIDLSGLRSRDRELEQQRQRLEEVIWGTDAGTWEWNVVTGETVFNERWANIVGYSLEDLMPTTIETWQRFVHPDDLARSAEALQRVFSRETVAYECDARMRHKNGEWVWVLDRGIVVEWTPEGEPLRMSGVHIDITARKRAEESAARLAALRDVFLRCHAQLLAANSESELLESAVATFVRERQLALAWIGMPRQDARHSIEIMAAAGEALRYLDDFMVAWSDGPYGQGPAGQVIRTGTPCVLRDLATEHAFTPWAKRAEREGLKSMMVAPVGVSDAGPTAILCLYSRNREAFDADEQALVVQYGRSLALAWRTFRAPPTDRCVRAGP
jgi:PAS domain S-box-containing protein